MARQGDVPTDVYGMRLTHLAVLCIVENLIRIIHQPELFLCGLLVCGANIWPKSVGVSLQGSPPVRLSDCDSTVKSQT